MQLGRGAALFDRIPGPRDCRRRRGPDVDSQLSNFDFGVIGGAGVHVGNDALGGSVRLIGGKVWHCGNEDVNATETFSVARHDGSGIHIFEQLRRPDRGRAGTGLRRAGPLHVDRHALPGHRFRRRQLRLRGARPGGGELIDSRLNTVEVCAYDGAPPNGRAGRRSATGCASASAATPTRCGWSRTSTRRCFFYSLLATADVDANALSGVSDIKFGLYDGVQVVAYTRT